MTFALWGLAFKPNTDDVRDAPAFAIIDGLLGKGARVCAYDPEAKETTHKIYGDSIVYASSPYEALAGAEALIIATEWNEFRNPDFDKMRSAMKNALIFDGRNLFTIDEMQESGFEYHSVGRVSVL